MICAGEGAGVIANIWNGSLDKSNICTMLRDEQTEAQRGREDRKEEGWFVMFMQVNSVKIFHERLTAFHLNARVHLREDDVGVCTL